MQALAEGFLKKQLAKSPFTIKTILDLVTFLKLNSQSRDTATLLKVIQDIYASDLMKEHLNKLPVESKNRLDRFMANSLDDFIELSHDPSPARFTGAVFSCLPVLCGSGSVAVVQTEIKEAQKALEDMEKVKVVIDQQLDELSNQIKAEIEKKPSTADRRASGGLVIREAANPMISVSAQPATESSSPSESSSSETKTDVSGNSVETIPEQTQEKIFS